MRPALPTTTGKQRVRHSGTPQALRWLLCDGRGMRLLNGAVVEPGADGCCVGLKGAGDTFALCMTEPTTSGLIVIPETGEFAWSRSHRVGAAALSHRPVPTRHVWPRPASSGFAQVPQGDPGGDGQKSQQHDGGSAERKCADDGADDADRDK